MSFARNQTMSQDSFFPWAAAQDGVRFEFDGERPVAMTGGSLIHNLVTVNILAALRQGLRGSACRVLGPDAGVTTIGGAVRYPDAVVTCAPLDPGGRLVPAPVAIFEVFSPGSARIDRVVKLREYNAVASIRHYVIVETETAAITSLSRADAGEPFAASGLERGDTLSLPACGVELPLDAVYEGVGLDL